MKGDDSKFGYWTSEEARLLFNPMPGESVIDCLHRRMQLLLDATTNDVVLLSIISGIDNLNELTTKQKENIRMQSLYLRNSYDNALSSMNQRTWAQCTSFAIEILSDTGLDYIKNEKTIRRWHIQFRKGDQFIVPNSKLAREPKLFNFFPEARTAIEKYCSKEINLGSLSSEALRNHINTTIIPECYQNMIDDAKEDRNSMPTYMELLHMLDLKTISLSTVWRWLILLGFKYSENK